MIIRKLFKFEGAHKVFNCSSTRCKYPNHGHSYIVYGGEEVIGVFESEFEGKKLISKLDSEDYVPVNGIPYKEYSIEEVEMNVLIERN